MADRFPPGVAAELRIYVYRLIDPRNGETFYVGKGAGDRVFAHAKGVMADGEDAMDEKIQRIKEIRAAGLEVGHVIHRHGIQDEKTAYEVEAALIDAYPGLTNKVLGHRSGDYGPAHADQIIQRYTAEPFIPQHRIVLISIGGTFGAEDLSLYDATRCCWRLDPQRARACELVLAHTGGLVVEVFRPDEWLPATTENFPGLIPDDVPNRWGFVGAVAEEPVRRLYLRKLVPAEFRRRGAANPIRFIEPAPVSNLPNGTAADAPASA